MSRTTESEPATTASTTRHDPPAPDAALGVALGAAEAAVHLEQIADLVDRGDPRGARRCMEWLTARIDDATRALLVDCLRALEAPGPKSRTARLDFLLERADVIERALVLACLPRTDARRGDPTGASQRPAQDLARAAREHATRRVAPTGPRRSSRDAATLRGTSRYFEQTDESGHGRGDSDEDLREGLPYDGGDALEFSIEPLRGTACVACFCERSVADQRRQPDDGLCESCRESGRPGIPAPSQRGTRGEAVADRCRFLTEQVGDPATALALLRRDYRAAARGDRGIIVAWVHEQPTLAALLAE